MSLALTYQRLPAFFRVRNDRLFKYGVVVTAGLFVYLLFGPFAVCSLAALASLGIATKEKVDKIEKSENQAFTDISVPRYVDGGTFHQADEVTTSARAFVIDGGSFERFQP